jgi:indole-3-glycerol phosphate synthase
MILDDILAAKRVEVAARRRSTPVEVFRDSPRYREPRRGFLRALAKDPVPAIIAELKRASPSKGRIRDDYDPAAIAQGYERAGARCLSVLTDTPYFEGTLAHLETVRDAVGLPCLRKDFLIDPYQIDEARAAGADAVLVIAAAGTAAERSALIESAAAAELDVLVEVHDERELAWALDVGAGLIGINNRDLRTFETRLETTERLAPQVPQGVVLVAESGVRSRVDVERMVRAGARALLVGESLMRAKEPGLALRELLACP